MGERPGHRAGPLACSEQRKREKAKRENETRKAEKREAKKLERKSSKRKSERENDREATRSRAPNKSGADQQKGPIPAESAEPDGRSWTPSGYPEICLKALTCTYTLFRLVGRASSPVRPAPRRPVLSSPNRPIFGARIGPKCRASPIGPKSAPRSPGPRRPPHDVRVSPSLTPSTRAHARAPRFLPSCPKPPKPPKPPSLSRPLDPPDPAGPDSSRSAPPRSTSART